MGIRTEIREKIRKETVTNIHGQPTSRDITTLEKEINAILANIPTTLGGGYHGHIGIIMDPTEYNTMMGGTEAEAQISPVQQTQESTQRASQQTQSQEPEPEQKQSTKNWSTNTKLSKELNWEQKISSWKQSTKNTSAKLNTKR